MKNGSFWWVWGMGALILAVALSTAWQTSEVNAQCSGCGGSGGQAGTTHDHGNSRGATTPQRTTTPQRPPLRLSGEVLAVDPRAGVLSLRVDLPLKPDRDEQAARAAQEFLASLRRGQRVATTAEVDDRGNVALVGIEPLRGTTVTLRLRGLACDACVERIEESLRSVRGVEEARASLDPMQVVVTYDPQQVSLSQLRQAVRDIEPVHPDQRYEVVE